MKAELESKKRLVMVTRSLIEGDFPERWMEYGWSKSLI